MASARDIKNRIKGVKNIQQITRTMEMVAAAKLRRAQIAAQHARPYAEKINEMIHNISKSISGIQHPLIKERPIQKIAMVVVSSNKGLCGSFNGNILRETEKYIKKHTGKEFIFFCVGKKANEYFSRRGYKVSKFILPSEKEIEMSVIRELVQDISEGYQKEEFDEVVIFYSKFVSAIIQTPLHIAIIPFSGPEFNEETGGEELGADMASDYLFEPEPEELMSDLIPKFIESQVYNALAQSQAGEQAARLVAMKNATDNAKEMIQALTLSYNKARQAGITNEILEIVSGAEAIKEG